MALAGAVPILRLTLGLIFVVSAIAKLRHPRAFVDGVLAYDVLPPTLGRAYGWLLPYVELGAAALLLSGYLTSVAAGLVVLMLASFCVAVSVVAKQRRVIGCNCFGASHTGRVGWHTLGRDLTLLPLALGILGFNLVGGTSRALSGQPSFGTALLADILMALLLALAYFLVFRGFDLLAAFAQQKPVVGEPR